MGIQQAYDKLNKDAFWQMLMIYGVGCKLNKIKSLCVDNETFVKISSEELMV